MNTEIKNAYVISSDGLIRPITIVVGSPIAPKFDIIANYLPAKPAVAANIATADNNPVSLITLPDRTIVAQLRPNIRLFSRWTTPSADGYIYLNPHEPNRDSEEEIDPSTLVSRNWNAPGHWGLLYAVERFAGSMKSYLFLCSLKADETSGRFHLMRPPFPNIHEDGRICCDAEGGNPVDFLQSTIINFSDAPCCTDLQRVDEARRWVSYRVTEGNTIQVTPLAQPIDTLRAVSTQLTDLLSTLLASILNPGF